MRLIDAKKLVDMLYDNEFAMLCPLDEVSGVVDACPTVDAVVVTRCKDCKYRTGERSGLVRCRAFNYMPMRVDNFCSYGERRDGGVNNG